MAVENGYHKELATTIKEDYNHFVTEYKSSDKRWILSLDILVEKIAKYYYSLEHNEHFDLRSEYNKYKHFMDFIEELFVNNQELVKEIRQIRRLSNRIKHETHNKIGPELKMVSPYVINDVIDELQRKQKGNLIRLNIYLKEEDLKENIGNFESIPASEPNGNLDSYDSEHHVERKNKQISFDELREKISVPYSNAFVVSSMYHISKKTYVFRKPKFRDEVITKPFLAIANLLLRHDNVAQSDYVDGLKLYEEDLEKLYLFQLQLLFSFIERPTQKHYVTLREEDLNLVKQAIHDLKINFDHYTNVLKQDSDEYFFPIFELKIGQFRDKHMNLHVKGIESWIKDEIFNKKLYNRKFLVSKQEYDFVINESNIVDWNFFTQLIFGHDHLKKGQVETLHQFFINNEHETITCAILPTGYGKSLIYQLVSFLTPKVSVVVTPTPLLISDQLYNLNDNHFNQMAGNFLSQKEFRVGQSDYLLYYTTADLIYGETFTRFIKNMAPYLNMLIVDEVHQISLWSHNFDVNYLVVPNFLNRYFSNSKILFTTATASKRVRSDFNVKFSPRSIDYVMPEAMSRKTIDHEICDVESIDDIVNDLIERFDREYDSGEDLDLRKNNRILIINNDYNIRKKIYELLSNQEFLANYIMLFNGEEFSYEKFRNGVKKILVSSDDFNIGINIEKISSVITIMNPLSKEWFYQESGRISRNDSHGKALTYIISDSTVSHDALFKNISEDFFDELSVYKKYKSHSNLKRFFDYFNVIEKEKYNLMQLYNGLLKHNNGKSSLMFVPDEGEIYYNNALHFGFILGFIKDWTVQNRKRYDGFKEFKVEIGELNSDNHETLILENAIIFVKKYNVFSPITEWFVNFQGDYEEKLGAFVTWYYISKAYQQFDAMRSVVDMLSNEVPQSPQTNENIEKELELLFVTKKILHDIQQKSKINFNSLSEKAAKKSSSDELADNYIIEKENITNNKNKKQTINKPSQEDHNSEKIINDKPANDHKDKSFIESITSNNHDINSFEQLLNGFDTLGRQLNWQDLKLLVKNPYFMNGKNDMYFKVFFEEKLAEEYSEFFTACLGYYEIKNNIRISRLRTLYHELNTEDIIEFTRLLIKEFNPQIYNRHDFIELVYKEIGYDSAYYLFQESNSSKFLVKLYAYVDNFNMEVN